MLPLQPPNVYPLSVKADAAFVAVVYFIVTFAGAVPWPLALYVNVAVFSVQFATIVTVPPFVSVKFLKYVLVTFVVPFHVVVGVADVPCFALLPTVAVHPANVYPVLVGLLIITSWLYVPLVGAFVPAVPLFNV